MRKALIIAVLLLGLIIGYLAGCRSHVQSRGTTHERNNTKMTLNEIRCIYPSYAEKERLLRETKWAEWTDQCKKIALEKKPQRGIINDERSGDGNNK